MVVKSVGISMARLTCASRLRCELAAISGLTTWVDMRQWSTIPRNDLQDRRRGDGFPHRLRSKSPKRNIATDGVRKATRSRASESPSPGEGMGEPHAGERRYMKVPAGPQRSRRAERQRPNSPAIEEEQLARPVLCPTQQATELLFGVRRIHTRERNPPIAQYSSFVLSPRNAYHSHDISSIVDTNVYHHEHAQTSSK
jgi:hypothetical protein